MSDYKPGTVAMVTYKGERVRAFKFSRNMWTMLLDAGPHSCNESPLTDVTPLVCIEATLEDADALAKWLRSVGPQRPTTDASNALVATIQRYHDAIREQTPVQLVIPERLGAVVEARPCGKYEPVKVVYAPSGNRTGDPWLWTNGGARCSTDDLRQPGFLVRVLSEGVTP